MNAPSVYPQIFLKRHNFESWRDTTGSTEDLDGKKVHILYRMPSGGPNGIGEFDTVNNNCPTNRATNPIADINGLYDGTKSKGDLLFSDRGLHNN
jgi:hypothetical protein